MLVAVRHATYVINLKTGRTLKKIKLFTDTNHIRTVSEISPFLLILCKILNVFI